MKIAISPCPNDTHLFYAWIKGLVAPAPTVTFADIQELNQMAQTSQYPLIKISYHCFPKISKHYQLLPIGSALGFHVGPKIISNTPFTTNELSQKKIAIPGKDTTAHYLLNHLLPLPAKKHFCLYHEVEDLVERNVVDCGLIIHETRFTFQDKGLFEIVDLGKLWHQKYALPLPLGGLVIKRDYPHKDKVIENLKKSLNHADQFPLQSREFILEHSQDKKVEIVDQHIATYVNEETKNLSSTGVKAIETLTGLCLKNSLYLPQKMKPMPRSVY